MIHFKTIDTKTFLKDYWQKKPLIIRQALPDFINPLSPDELAGLALEDEVESRLVLETPNSAPYWQLKTGPFLESDFSTLPKTHWTLLVQGVDRLIPDVASLLNHFDFIPQWRIDDVMISYAVNQGSVGPHYDNYDVFLYQASGQRLWSLTTKDCNQENYLNDVELRIMNRFEVEEEFLLEAGDMLYLPPHVGHHGVSQSDDCMTYSFGYRSYQGVELWNSYGDYLADQNNSLLYKDPDWSEGQATSEISSSALLNAKRVMQQLLGNEQQMKSWFGSFITSLDQQAELQLALPLTDDEVVDLPNFINELAASEGMMRDAGCRFAYYDDDDLQLFVNGCAWDISDVDHVLIKYVANNRFVAIDKLQPFLTQQDNQIFLFELWKLQWLYWPES